MNELITNTRVFPLAIRNDDTDVCVGFVGRINKARTLRKARTSQKTSAERNIIAVFGKRNSDELFDEIVYVKNGENILSICPDICNLISPNAKGLLNREAYYIYDLNRRQVRKLYIYQQRHVPMCFRADTYMERMKRSKLQRVS